MSTFCHASLYPIRIPPPAQLWREHTLWFEWTASRPHACPIACASSQSNGSIPSYCPVTCAQPYPPLDLLIPPNPTYSSPQRLRCNGIAVVLSVSSPLMAGAGLPFYFSRPPCRGAVCDGAPGEGGAPRDQTTRHNKTKPLLLVLVEVEFAISIQRFSIRRIAP